jgi:hypothetical protein
MTKLLVEYTRHDAPYMPGDRASFEPEVAKGVVLSRVAIFPDDPEFADRTEGEQAAALEAIVETEAEGETGGDAGGSGETGGTAAERIAAKVGAKKKPAA